MKKWFIAILAVFIILCGDSVMASCPYGVDDMPTPPALPEWSDGYFITFKYDERYNPFGCSVMYWNLYVVDNWDGITTFGDVGLRIGNAKTLNYRVAVNYDKHLDIYYFTDWWVYADCYYTGQLIDGLDKVIWSQWDILTPDGNVAYAANPIPPLPLIGTVQLETVPEVVRGMAKTTIPVGLVVLLMLLLVVLIRYLLRSLLLRIKS